MSRNVSRSPNKRHCRWTQLTLIAAAVRGAVAGILSAMVEMLLDLI